MRIGSDPELLLQGALEDDGGVRHLVPTAKRVIQGSVSKKTAVAIATDVAWMTTRRRSARKFDSAPPPSTNS